MAVLLSDRALTCEVKNHPWERDAHGVPVPSPDTAVETRGPYPGAAKEQGDQTWTLRVDPRCWPLMAGDRITDDTGLTWVVAGIPRLHQLPKHPATDYIAVTAQLEPPRVP